MADNKAYIFGDPARDRQRLQIQNEVFSGYLRTHMARLVGSDMQSILDLGCGEGLAQSILHEIYPRAKLVGVDKDPRAIARAQETAVEQGLHHTEYVVGDVEQALPAGPFDLIYISLVLLHTHLPAKILELAYAVLRPGGQIWIRDLVGIDDSIAAIDHPAYHRLAELVFQAHTAIGGNSDIMLLLPGLLTAAGFVDIRQVYEEYPMGGPTAEGQAMLASTLGVYYNARPMVSKTLKVAMSELERLHGEVCNLALRSPQPIGTQRF